MTDEKIMPHLGDIDEGIRDLVLALNRIDGIDTVASCEGHDKARVGVYLAWVIFKVRDMETLNRLARKITFGKEGERYYTRFEERTGEYISGYWIETYCEYKESYPLFILKVYSPDKQRRRGWIQYLLERLER